MKNQLGEKHIVIGAGVSGCVTAILKKRAGYDVVMLERHESPYPDVLPVGIETCNIVSENHSGAEYPYDPQSARDCFDGRLDNEKFFPSFIYGGKTSSRIIASQSMVDEGHDIVLQCRSNMAVLRKHYANRIAENFRNYFFGSPETAFREVPAPADVRDVAATFVTPQRGFNTLYVGLALQHELKRLGIEFIQGAEVTAVRKQGQGFDVDYRLNGAPESISGDQVSICAAAFGFKLAHRLNPELELPNIHLALRSIIYVDLPDGCSKDFTCLKLEDKYGAMLSPLGPNTALVYHPPAAHIDWQVLTGNREYPVDYARALSHGHPLQEATATRALHAARRYYPELERSRIVSQFLKVAINTTCDSRQRRNMGVFKVANGCSMLILPKWTMCVSDAKKDLIMALTESVRRGNLAEDDVRELLHGLSNVQLEVPEEWTRDRSSFLATAKKLARLTGVPEDLAHGLPLGGKAQPRQPAAQALA